MADDFRDFLSWIRQIGKRPDLVQGGGGNFSFKIDDRRMAIKASGFRFSEADEEKGLSFVDYPGISEFFGNREKSAIIEEQNFDLINSRILLGANGEKIRPSMEVGFHVFLGRYVVHTHSVYANIAACSEGGRELAEKIFADWEKPVMWLPYAQPGWALAMALKEAAENYKKRFGFLPETILLENHGLILAGDDWRHLADLQDKTIFSLRNFFPMIGDFPEIKIKERDSADVFLSQTGYLRDFLKNNSDIMKNFADHIIFPDQAVFCQDFGKRILFDPEESVFVYRAGEKESLAIEETLVAWAFILASIRATGRQWRPLTADSIDSLIGMESEKYRRNLMFFRKDE